MAIATSSQPAQRSRTSLQVTSAPVGYQSAAAPATFLVMDQKVSHVVMYILAVTLVVCLGVVLLFKGIDAVPHQWLGVAITLVLAVAALAMTRLSFGEAH